MFLDIDLMIRSALSVCSLWAGVAVILGSNFIPSILTMVHGLGMLIFLSNIWTPKVDNKDDYTLMLIALTEMFGAVLIGMGRKPETPPVTFK
jgi:hypothetical protein